MVSSFVFCSFCSISSISFGGGVEAIVQPIHAPMAIMAVKPMNTGMAMIQKRKPSRAGQKSPTQYSTAIVTQVRKMSRPIA